MHHLMRFWWKGPPELSWGASLLAEHWAANAACVPLEGCNRHIRRSGMHALAKSFKLVSFKANLLKGSFSLMQELKAVCVDPAPSG